MSPKPEEWHQYPGSGGSPAAFVFWLRRVEGGFKPSFEIVEEPRAEAAIRRALQIRDRLADDPAIERVVIGQIQQEIRRTPPKVNGGDVLPFRRNGS